MRAMLVGLIEGPSASAEQARAASNAGTKMALSLRNMRTRARARLGSLFIGRDLAVVDPLLVHPFPAEPFFAGKRIDRVRRRPGIAGGRRPLLSETIRRTEDRERQCEGWPR